MLSRFLSSPDRSRALSWLQGSPRAWLVAVIVLAMLPLAAVAAVLAVAAGSATAITAALVAGGASLALAVLLATRAARKLSGEALLQAQAAAAASQARDDFLGMLSHELRNRLGAIGAAVDVLESPGMQGDTAAEARSIIARQSRQLAQLMNELLDLSRVAAGTTQLARQPLDLAALVQRVRQAVASTGAAAGHPLSCRLESVWADGDAARLEQVVSWLLTNALRRAPPGAEIVLSVRREAGTALLDLRSGEAGVLGGPAIGLALIRRLVELHGGTLDATSAPQGVRFTVRLPAVEPVVAPDDDSLPPLRRRTVLVVEDNEEVLAVLRARLERDGHTVSTAADGRDGLRRLLSQRPEVSIVAIGPPGSSAFALARDARAAGYAGRIIGMFAGERESDVAAAMVAGFDACLVAPVDHAQLRASIAGS